MSYDNVNFSTRSRIHTYTFCTRTRITGKFVRALTYQYCARSLRINTSSWEFSFWWKKNRLMCIKYPTKLKNFFDLGFPLKLHWIVAKIDPPIFYHRKLFAISFENFTKNGFGYYTMANIIHFKWELFQKMSLCHFVIKANLSLTWRHNETWIMFNGWTSTEPVFWMD